MKCKIKKKSRCDYQSGGYTEGYGYPFNYYGINYDDNGNGTPPVKGSFWVACHKKSKGRHSFCDDV